MMKMHLFVIAVAFGITGILCASLGMCAAETRPRVDLLDATRVNPNEDLGDVLGQSDVRSGRIAGVVRDAISGAPIASARVSLLSRVGKELSLVTTSVEGEFSFLNRDSGSSSLCVRADGYRDLFCVAVQGESVECLMQRAATIKGRVLDRETGSPMEDVRVVLTSPDGSSLTTRSNRQGFFAIMGVIDVSYSMTAFADKRPPSRAVAITAGGRGADALTVLISRGVQLTGLVQDAVSGMPVSGATVKIERDPRATATTDAHGKFVLSGLPSGRSLSEGSIGQGWTVTHVLIDCEGYASARKGVVRCPWGGAQRTVVDLQPSGTIDGRVCTLRGVPVPGATIRLADPLGRDILVTSDDAGEFMLHRILPGEEESD